MRYSFCNVALSADSSYVPLAEEHSHSTHGFRKKKYFTHKSHKVVYNVVSPSVALPRVSRDAGLEVNRGEGGSVKGIFV